MSEEKKEMQTIMDFKKQLVKYLNTDEISNRILSLYQGDKHKMERFKATLLNVALSPELAICSPESIIKAGMEIAELDLPLSEQLDQAYIVPYWNDSIKKYEARAEVSYKGWLALAKRISYKVKAHPIYKCDKFSYKINGFEEDITLIPNLTDLVGQL